MNPCLAPNERSSKKLKGWLESWSVIKKWALTIILSYQFQKKTKTTKGKKRKKADYSNMKASWSREVNQTYLGIEEVKFWLFIKAQLKDRAVRIITGCDDIFTCN